MPKGSDGVRMARIIATLRSAESGSAAVGFGIGSLQLAMYKLGVINLVFLAVVLVLGAWLHVWIWRADEKGSFGYAEDWEAAAAQDEVRGGEGK
ncbi:hypothetical protein Q8F55_007176 [Vanrija albida]|uniref:Uncharacterized protein n=1 Tax=Vanrija albida TaxID=181172 RepID=A0ABR3PZE5_9TREE